MYSIYLSTSHLLTFINSNTYTHEFSSVWKRINCSNGIMNQTDWVIKLDVYPQKNHSCSKNTHGISFLF